MTRRLSSRIAAARRTAVLPVILTLGLAILPGVAPTPAPARTPATAQQPAVLVADQVFLEGKTRLVAQGHVEALQGDVRIKAQRISYDRSADRLVIDGPITITQGEDVVVLANQAEMDPGFHNALLTGARMVLNQQVQLAAHQLNRVNGRYSQMYKAAVTSCQVCSADTPPLWQIRARRVIHDQVERQLYFEDAQLRVMDVPIFYLPHLRLPDPTLKRATGFLIPSLRGNSQLGTGIKVPYFIRMGDHRDAAPSNRFSAVHPRSGFHARPLCSETPGHRTNRSNTGVARPHPIEGLRPGWFLRQPILRCAWSSPSGIQFLVGFNGAGFTASLSRQNGVPAPHAPPGHAQQIPHRPHAHAGTPR